MTRNILFVCPHGAAKSVMAAAYFQQLADQYRLDYRALCAGTEPDAIVAPPVAHLLQAEGVGFPAAAPHKPTAYELASAQYIISLGCTAAELDVAPERVEHWDDVPPPSQNLPASRDAIFAHVEVFISRLQNRT